MRWIGMASCLFSTLAFAAPVAESQFDVLGYSPELNAIFAQGYVVPDNGKCVSYILDLEKKTKFVLPATAGVGEAVLGAGGDEEAASCPTREFEGQLEIKLKTAKTYSADEKKLVEPVEKADWKKALPGFKDGRAASIGAWLHIQRSKWHPEIATKLYELGTTTAEDKDWLDGFSALVISADWKPGYSTKAGRAQAEKITALAEKMAASTDAKEVDKAILALEMAVRLDSKNARAWMNLAKQGRGGFERAATLLARVLQLDPVLATRAFREDEGFRALRCEKKAEAARRKLPAQLIADLKCS